MGKDDGGAEGEMSRGTRIGAVGGNGMMGGAVGGGQVGGVREASA